MTWMSSPAHRHWLLGEAQRLLTFGRASRCQDGFGALGLDGELLTDRPVHTYVTCRMVHTFALAEMLGLPGYADLVEHGLAALTTSARDDAGGWVRARGPGAAVQDGKDSYTHAFVVLAAASATMAGHTPAQPLLTEALEVFRDRFWDEEAGLAVESWDREFTQQEDYRGINANMHTLEAFLAAYQATDNRVWLHRARRIARFAVTAAERNDWMLPEHFSATWDQLDDFNADNPEDPFRPYGVTVGHWLEWARLLVSLRTGLVEAGLEDDPGLLAAARQLFDAAVQRGWSADGAPGFVYTLGWDATPVVRLRIHWVLCEAIAAAAVLHTATGEAHYATWYRRWWEYAATHFLDLERGSWWHELDPDHRPSGRIWPEKSDIYHAVQATLLPLLPLAPSVAGAVARHPTQHRA